MTPFEDLPALADAGLFGESTSEAEAHVVVVGVPWEPTVSYGRGTSAAPGAVVAASHQLDLFDPFLGAELGDEIAMAPPRADWIALNESATQCAKQIIEAGGRLSPRLEPALASVNRASEQLNRELQQKVALLIADGKSVGIFGGDHSCPLGSMLAHADHYGSFGVLHIDAHFDLRDAYEGFTHSHASIMFNLLAASDRISALVPVGIRDYSEQEARIAAEHPAITTFFDRDLKRARFHGKTWSDSCSEIVAALPEQVYVSFDIDGLDPNLCPNTGTPVPGGLEYAEAIHLLESVVSAGKRIIGFDLVEVSPNREQPDDEWDLNVAARLLHKLCVLTWMGRKG